MIESRDQAIAWLDAHIGRGMRPGLERMAALLEVLGDPTSGYPVIHVAGTNGKTTVTRVASAVLTAHGLRVGTTISPHLERFEERLMLDLGPATAEALTQAVADLAIFADLFEERSGMEPTYFELSTALAFSYFASHSVDVAVVEVGMGGRLDATNVIDSDVAVVTSIARDHTEWLGETLQEIAGEKLAIVNEDSVLVTGPLPDVVDPIAEARAAELGIPRRAWNRDFRVKSAQLAVGGWHLDISGVYADHDDLYLPMHGRHQVHNAVVALVAAEELFGRGLDPEAVTEAFAAITSPGRIEVIERNPLVVIDGAHNPSGFEALCSTLVEEFGARRWTVVLAAMGDKELADMVRHLVGLHDDIIVTSIDDPRAIPPAELAGVIRDVLDTDPKIEGDPNAAVALAKELAGPEGAVLVAGSIYLVGAVRGGLGG